MIHILASAPIRAWRRFLNSFHSQGGRFPWEIGQQRFVCKFSSIAVQVAQRKSVHIQMNYFCRAAPRFCDRTPLGYFELTWRNAPGPAAPLPGETDSQALVVAFFATNWPRLQLVAVKMFFRWREDNRLISIISSVKLLAGSPDGVVLSARPCAVGAALSVAEVNSLNLCRLHCLVQAKGRNACGQGAPLKCQHILRLMTARTTS